MTPVWVTSGGAVVSVSPLPAPLSVTTLVSLPVESPNHVSVFMLDALDLPVFTAVTGADVALAELEARPEVGPEPAPAILESVMAVIPAYPLPRPVGNVPANVAFNEDNIASTLDGMGAIVVLRLVMQMLGRSSSMESGMPKARLHQ